MYSKILKNLILLFALCFVLFYFISRINVPIYVYIVLGVAICIVFASHLSKSITDSINKIDFSKENPFCPYKELEPFVSSVSNYAKDMKKQIKDLENSNLTLNALSESMSEGLITLDGKQNIIFANESIKRIFNLTKENISGVNIKELTDHNVILGNIRKALSGTATSGVFEFNEKSYKVFSSPLYYDESPSGVVLIFFDVSADMQSAKIRREFSANVSHELKTPLTSILGYSQIINGGIAKENDILKFTQKIEKEASRLINLINDIIQLSKLDEAKGAEQRENILLLPLIEEIAESLEEKAKEKEVTLSTDGDNTVVFGNKAQISELIYNLIENGIKYNKEGGSVNITVFKKVLSVSDTGIGIPEKYKERIFERFFRVDKSHSNQVSGTGLGLSIVKHIAIQNNAEIFLESTENVGSTFTVEF